MTSSIDQFGRVALITELVRTSKVPLGRTAVMKLLYFLQELKDIPLGYHFGLYTYGPFDSDVLNDLGLAERVGAVESRVFQFQGGQGYVLHPARTEKVLDRARDLVSRYKDAIEWALNEFGERSALDLEMASTIVYVDRSAAEEGNRTSMAELVRKVRNIKPHLEVQRIEREANSLRDRGLIAPTLSS